jgi:hypothetical protein
LPIITRVRKALNAFVTYEERPDQIQNIGPGSSSRPDKPRLMIYNDRSLISSIYTRLSIDVAGISVRHVKVDEEGRYSGVADTGLNDCFTLEPNLDQGPRAFLQDAALTLFDKGVVAIVPVETDQDPSLTRDFDIYQLRIGHVTEWHPRHVKVSVYNEKIGHRQEIVLEKRNVAIVENPLYAVMNEPNSTLQRLIRKLALLDSVDEATGSGKLDLIIQLPYVIKSEARQAQAEKRRQDIEFQLRGSQYGIAYTDGTEKITQLNRPAENNLLKQIEYLTNQLFNQLGLTPEVMNGTADEKVMIAYFNRTVEPVLDAIVQAAQRSFVGTPRVKKGERIKYFRDPFKLVPVADLAEIADKFSRNEILSSNEIRGFLGFMPHKDPKADQLLNSNMPQPSLDPTTATATSTPAPPSGPSFDEVNQMVGDAFDRIKTNIEGITSELTSG